MYLALRYPQLVDRLTEPGSLTRCSSLVTGGIGRCVHTYVQSLAGGQMPKPRYGKLKPDTTYHDSSNKFFLAVQFMKLNGEVLDRLLSSDAPCLCPEDVDVSLDDLTRYLSAVCKESNATRLIEDWIDGGLLYRRSRISRIRSSHQFTRPIDALVYFKGVSSKDATALSLMFEMVLGSGSINAGTLMEAILRPHLANFPPFAAAFGKYSPSTIHQQESPLYRRR
eukprot:Opistho-2@18821